MPLAIDMMTRSVVTLCALQRLPTTAVDDNIAQKIALVLSNLGDMYAIAGRGGEAAEAYTLSKRVYSRLGYIQSQRREIPGRKCTVNEALGAVSLSALLYCQDPVVMDLVSSWTSRLSLSLPPHEDGANRLLASSSTSQEEEAGVSMGFAADLQYLDSMLAALAVMSQQEQLQREKTLNEGCVVS